MTLSDLDGSGSHVDTKFNSRFPVVASKPMVRGDSGIDASSSAANDSA